MHESVCMEKGVRERERAQKSELALDHCQWSYLLTYFSVVENLTDSDSGDLVF